MRQYISVFRFAFSSAWQELYSNKTRSFLSIFGITIGIFCIISILTMVSSLKINIRNELNTLGSQTIYLDKWNYTANRNNEYPWWVYATRPEPKYEEIELIKQNTTIPLWAAFKNGLVTQVSYQGLSAPNTRLYSVSPDFNKIQSIPILLGHYITEAEFSQALPVAVIGYNKAKHLFTTAQNALGKTIEKDSLKIKIVGVIKPTGEQLIGGWDFDNCIIIPYLFGKIFIPIQKADPLIVIKAKNNQSYELLKEELIGIMRSIRQLKLTDKNNFALNNINDFSERLNEATATLQTGGWAIAALSLLIGMFGVANILFASVNERIQVTGLKKSVGATQKMLLLEMIIEAICLCFAGGIIALALVFGVVKIAAFFVDFPLYLTLPNIAIGLVSSLFIGILSGILPALRTSRQNPIVALKSAL